MTDYTRKVDIVKDSANVAGRKTIVFVDASSLTTVPAGSSETITVQPPSGKIWRVVGCGFWCDPPSGATSGNHQVYIYCRPSTLTIIGVKVSSSYDKSVRIEYGSNALESPTPSDQVAFLHSLQSVIGTYDIPFKVHYWNSTDADQTNERKIELLLEEEDEAE